MLTLQEQDLPRQHNPSGSNQQIAKEIIEANRDARREAGEYVREGNILIFEAPQRKGKTLGATIWSVDSYQHGRKVFSTIEFKFPHEKLDFYKLKLAQEAGQENPILNAHLFVDELNFYLDARAAMSKVNRDFSAFLLQTKKQGCLMTGTTHAIKSLEMRFRDNYDYRIIPEVYPKYPATPKIIKLRILNGPVQPFMDKTIKLNCTPYLGLYDTRSFYNPFNSMPPATKSGKNPSTHHARLNPFNG